MHTPRFYKTEDGWAIFLGAFLLLMGLTLFFLNPPDNLSQQHQAFDQQLEAASQAPYSTIAWHDAFDQQQKLKGSGEPIGKILTKLTDDPGGWSDNPLTSFFLSESAAEVKKQAVANDHQQLKVETEGLKAKAVIADDLAEKMNYEDAEMNERAVIAIENWRNAKSDYSNIKKKYETKAYNKAPWLLVLMLFLGVLFAFGAKAMGKDLVSFWKGFAFVFLLATISFFLAGQANMKAIGFGYAAWAIILGLLISNTIGTPKWVNPALSTAFYIKTGLILLGAEILLGKILAIGLPGIFVAWIVTPIVLISTYWFGQKVLKIPSKTLNMTISADMSVCGVSAAVATAAACKADKEELTLAIGLSMIFTSIMMIVLPAFINWMEMPEVLGGAWIGGTIDATGAVVAAGAFLGEDALSVAATIKMIQNVLIGVIAFGVAVYFATKVENEKNGTPDVKIGVGEIWKRFPKFILGFMGASIVFSILYEAIGENQAYTLIDQGVIRGFTKNLRGWLFCIAFVSIGLSTNFKELRRHFSGGKPLILYLCGQTLNLALTLLMAYIMFYLVFPEVTAGI